MYEIGKVLQITVTGTACEGHPPSDERRQSRSPTVTRSIKCPSRSWARLPVCEMLASSFTRPGVPVPRAIPGFDRTEKDRSQATITDAAVLLPPGLTTAYLSSLLQRPLVAPTPVSDSLARYRMRDLLKSAAGRVSRGKSGRADTPLSPGALGIASGVVASQLRMRDAMLPASAFPPATPSLLSVQGSSIPNARAAAQERSAALIPGSVVAWKAARASENVALEGRIRERRAPKQVYFRSAASYAVGGNVRTNFLSAAAARSGASRTSDAASSSGATDLDASGSSAISSDAALGGGDTLPLSTRAQSVQPTLSQLDADDSTVVAFPVIPTSTRRLVIPVVYPEPSAPATTRRGGETLLDWWAARDVDAKRGGAASGEGDGAGAVATFESPSARVIASASKLVTRFEADGTAAAARIVTAAARFGVTLAPSAPDVASGVGLDVRAWPRPELPCARDLAHALRPASAALLGPLLPRRELPQRPATTAAPAKGKEGAAGAPPVVGFVATNFTGGLYGESGMSLANRLDQLRERVIAQENKRIAAEKKAAKAGGAKK